MDNAILIYRLSARRAVYLSHCGIVSKRMHVSSSLSTRAIKPRLGGSEKGPTFEKTTVQCG